MKLEGTNTGMVTRKSFEKSLRTSKPLPCGLSAYLGLIT